MFEQIAEEVLASSGQSVLQIEQTGVLIYLCRLLPQIRLPHARIGEQILHPPAKVIVPDSITYPRPAASSASLAFCSTSRIVTPSEAICRTNRVDREFEGDTAGLAYALAHPLCKF